MPNCGSLVPKLCELNMSRISDQFAVNWEPNTSPTIREMTTAMRRALLELTLLPISMVSPFTRMVEPSAASGRAHIASVAEMKPTAAMSTAYASQRPTLVPSCVQITLWKPSWLYHMTSVTNCASAKNSPMTMASASTTPMKILLPFDGLRGRFGLLVMRGPEGRFGGTFDDGCGPSPPSVSTLRMIGSSLLGLRGFCLPARFEPPSGSNMGPNISKKDMLIA